MIIYIGLYGFNVLQCTVIWIVYKIIKVSLKDEQ